MSELDEEPKTLLDRARKHYKLADEAWSEQRKREKEDLEFLLPENQWSEEARREREGRPLLCISRVDQPIQLMQHLRDRRLHGPKRVG